jgi:HEAT repeat protein
MGASYNDPETRKIIKYQDAQKLDSLLPYLQSKTPSLRLAAVKAFGSIKSPVAIDYLIKMLKDPVIEVRSMAAFSLGQIGNEKAETGLISAFAGRDTTGVNNVFNQNVLEALGKCGSKTTLKNIASVVSYRMTDDQLLLGQMRSIYRFGLRNVFDLSATQTALKYVANPSYPQKVRLLAAHYLGRFKEATEDGMNDKLITYLESEDDPYIKMALATAAGRSGNSGSYLKKLISIIESEKDYRVKCNLTKSLTNFEFDSVKTVVYKLINDPNPHVASLASEIIGKKGIKEELYVYKGLITETQDWKIKTKLYQSLFKA